MSNALHLRPFQSLLIANRGEIACRIAVTARAMGKRVVAVFSSADARAPHVCMADEAVEIGGPLPGESYLNIEAILAAARSTGVQAIHPGYGFLAENDRFAQAVLDAGLVWIGPPPVAMRAMGSKAGGRRLARQLGVPVLEGYEGEDQTDATLQTQARRIGFPLLIKASAGGGGRGMRWVSDAGEFAVALDSARAEALAAFGEATVILERALTAARHIEVQVFADAHGNCIHLGERDCSVQRRHQKLIEEAPAPNLPAPTRASMCSHAVALARAIGYVGAGTMEFLLGADGQYAFMEMNTRLQVEHPVTEALTGVDLVEWQLRVAAGEPLHQRQEAITFSGHAIEVRLCAEDASREFAPQSGALVGWEPPAHAEPFARHAPLRVDSAVSTDVEISPYYDSMIAKVIAHGTTRDAAREQLAAALDAFVVLGVVTNKPLLAGILRDAEFAAARHDTTYIRHALDRLAVPAPSREAVAVAALLMGMDHARAAGFGEWSMWSNAASQPSHIGLEDQDHTYAARIQRAGNGFEVVVDQAGRTDTATPRASDATSAHAAAPASIALQIDAIDGANAIVRRMHAPRETVRVAYHRGDRTIALSMRGHAWHFSEPAAGAGTRRARAKSDGRVLAPMTGRVVIVHVQPGYRVPAGAPLLALSAMKMEHVIAAPCSLIVSRVHVAVDDQVRAGLLLLEFSPG